MSPSPVDIETVDRCLRDSAPDVLDIDGAVRAATALCLRRGDAGVEALFIRRTIRPDDKWSGHMALPGGRVEPGDASLLAAAERETREEVGIDLAGSARFLGILDEVQAWARGHPIPMVVTPHVFALTGPVEVRPDPAEVEVHVWIPLDPLIRGEHDDQLEWEYGGGGVMLPCFQVGAYTIWGLTFRMLSNFFDLLRAAP